MTSSVSLSLVLMVQLEALQVVADDATGALNAPNDTLEDRLQDVSMRARELDLHGAHRSGVVALAIAQVRSEHNLRLVEFGFPEEENLDDY
jgi:hypothetical protein